MFLELEKGYWQIARDGEPEARKLYERHYSARRNRTGPNAALICGPGEKLVLITSMADALFVWRKFISMDNQRGVNCAVFRNESEHKSSDMIREAQNIAWRRWPGERLYTYVNAKKIRSANPGYCFKVAGWAFVGLTKRGLHILEIKQWGETQLRSMAK